MESKIKLMMMEKLPSHLIIDHIDKNISDDIYNYDSSYESYESIMIDCFAYNYPDVAEYIYNRGGFVFLKNNQPIIDYINESIISGNVNFKFLDWLIHNHFIDKFITSSLYEKSIDDNYESIESYISSILNILILQNPPNIKFVDWIIDYFPFLSHSQYDTIIYIGYKSDIDTMIRYINYYNYSKPIEYIYNINSIVEKIYSNALFDSRTEIIEYLENNFSISPYTKEIDRIKNNNISYLFSGIEKDLNYSFILPHLLFMIPPNIMKLSIQKYIADLSIDNSISFWESLLIQSIYVSNIKTIKMIFKMIPEDIVINKYNITREMQNIVDLSKTNSIFSIRRQQVFLWLKNNKNIDIVVSRDRTHSNEYIPCYSDKLLTVSEW